MTEHLVGRSRIQAPVCCSALIRYRYTFVHIFEDRSVSLLLKCRGIFMVVISVHTFTSAILCHIRINRDKCRAQTIFLYGIRMPFVDRFENVRDWKSYVNYDYFVLSCLTFHELCVTQQVDMVIIPATTGQMGVLPGHVSTIAELKPGVLSVHEGNDVTKYFVSSGFAFIHANSFTDIIAVEAVPLDRIDPNQVQKGLAEFTQKLSSATTDLEKAEAQIGVDMHSALNSALTG